MYVFSQKYNLCENFARIKFRGWRILKIFTRIKFRGNGPNSRKLIHFKSVVKTYIVALFVNFSIFCNQRRAIKQSTLLGETLEIFFRFYLEDKLSRMSFLE